MITRVKSSKLEKQKLRRFQCLISKNVLRFKIKMTVFWIRSKVVDSRLTGKFKFKSSSHSTPNDPQITW
jgi:hypothetical protein